MVPKLIEYPGFNPTNESLFLPSPSKPDGRKKKERKKGGGGGWIIKTWLFGAPVPYAKRSESQRLHNPNLPNRAWGSTFRPPPPNPSRVLSRFSLSLSRQSMRSTFAKSIACRRRRETTHQRQPLPLLFYERGLPLTPVAKCRIRLDKTFYLWRTFFFSPPPLFILSFTAIASKVHLYIAHRCSAQTITF